MNIVVTGANGLVGRETVRLLIASGDHHVTALDAEVDLRDYSAVAHALKRSAPDVLVHLGGISGPMVRANEPAVVTGVNALGTVNLLSVAHGLRRVPRVVLASSIAAIEQRPGPTPSIYAATKRFVEDAARYFVEQGMQITTIRLGSVYGPGRVTDHIIHSLTRSLSHSGFAICDPDALEPLVHVSDAGQILVSAAMLPFAVGGVLTAVQDCVPHGLLARYVAHSLEVPSVVRTARRERLTWREPLDNGPLQCALGVGFEVPVARGVREVVRALTA